METATETQTTSFKGIEQLRVVLEQKLGRQVDDVEAKEIGDSLLEFYLVLAGEDL